MYGARQMLCFRSHDQTAPARVPDPENLPLDDRPGTITKSDLEERFPPTKYGVWRVRCHRDSVWGESVPHEDAPRSEAGSKDDSGRHVQPEGKTPIKTSEPGAISPDALEDIPLDRKDGNDGIEANAEHVNLSCVICMESFNDEDSIRVLSCGHIFHAGCVDPWLTKRQARCPLCKTKFSRPASQPQPSSHVYASRTIMPSIPAAVLVHSLATSHAR
ncbi:putative RING finger protein [Aspergillus candidus]|uniref:RING-type E3 ubiquitin transferase n=1 Tax=Aspergillus candidus TaxID=41067 RepID=A0A2I2FGQ9_ASPCN|nr:hypothetical protein BDW47DRAFT_8307 [Aspergillus candidus]PLB39827.1 hypothetical protein BDW47DRAFT_8307 [Aspergillus candidus]